MSARVWRLVTYRLQSQSGRSNDGEAVPKGRDRIAREVSPSTGKVRGRRGTGPVRQRKASMDGGTRPSRPPAIRWRSSRRNLAFAARKPPARSSSRGTRRFTDLRQAGHRATCRVCTNRLICRRQPGETNREAAAAAVPRKFAEGRADVDGTAVQWCLAVRQLIATHRPCSRRRFNRAVVRVLSSKIIARLVSRPRAVRVTAAPVKTAKPFTPFDFRVMVRCCGSNRRGCR